jgi:micrococcal nuclease
MRQPTGLLLLLGLVALAGCTVGIAAGPSDTPTVDPGEGQVATVTAVVDGDTIDVRFEDGSTDRVRLLGVDTPETHVENTPEEFEGVPDTEAGRTCLGTVGERATDALAERLADRQVRIVPDPVADRRGGYDRLLAYVYLQGTDLNAWLIAEGHARVYDSEFSKAPAYSAAESNAQDDGLGVWDCRDGTLTTTVGAVEIPTLSDSSGSHLGEDSAVPAGRRPGVVAAT